MRCSPNLDRARSAPREGLGDRGRTSHSTTVLEAPPCPTAYVYRRRRHHRRRKEDAAMYFPHQDWSPMPEQPYGWHAQMRGPSVGTH